MPELARIKRRTHGKDLYYRTMGIPLRVGDPCIVEVERGIDYGKVMALGKEAEEKDQKKPPKKVIRVMTEADRRVVEDNRIAAGQAFITCQEKVKEKKIPMKLVTAEYSFDRSRLLFYFTAEGRIDFRELVKELAAIFKTRIEMRQIGVRDESRMRGGLGICGRLFCCLRYEDEFYRCAGRRFPRDGDEVTTPRGKGRVLDLNFLTESVLVELEEDLKLEFPLSEINQSQR